jgi:hypothetical protein
MTVRSFADLYSLMIKRPLLLGPSIMVEFSFLASFLAFESVLPDAEDGTDVVALWREECQRLHPQQPGLGLYCVERVRPELLREQLQRESAHVFQFVSESLATILDELEREGTRKAETAISRAKCESLLEFIRPYFQQPVFFYHKAKAYEAFLLGLISAYEYCLLGSYEEASTGLKWSKAVEQLPFSATRTLADVGTSQDEIVERSFRYSEAETERSYDQVRSGLSGMANRMTVLRAHSCRLFLGFV